MVTVANAVLTDTSQKWVSCRGASSAETNDAPNLGDQLLVHLASHVAGQLAADVRKGVLTSFVAGEVVG